MIDLKSKVLFKLAVIGVLILLLLLPTHMIEQLIQEREAVRLSAIDEVSSKWGRGQTITGPYISVPYKELGVERWLHFLPEELKINGDIQPEKRYRGIYDVVVYESALAIEGTFQTLNFQQHGVTAEEMQWDKARLNLGISDLKGIEKQISVNWNDTDVLFNSGTSTNKIAGQGVNALVPINEEADYAFSMQIKLEGSKHLYFVPLGKTTDVSISSNWNTPSFTGNYLPDKREVSDEGFSANWNVLHLNRNYPQSWKDGDDYRVSNSSFGADLLLSVDNYKKSYRVARYAILFIVLTFMVFFFVEVLNKVFIHPIQYLLVGVALVVFYTLLLSFGEHIRFNWAYLIAATLTLTLVTVYTTAILKSKPLGGLIFGVLAVLYTFTFTIIQLQDYALLIGSIGVFTILAIVMFFSRKIDWYNIKIGKEADVLVDV